MRILHVFDHSLPLHSGYTFRSIALLTEQRKLGWDTFHITSAKQSSGAIKTEQVDGWDFYRTPSKRGFISRLPLFNQWAIIRGLQERLEQVVPEVKPDVIHAHSPSLNGIAAIRVGRRHNIPTVYESRASWEDAAVDHGSTTQGSMRYRISRAMESWAFRNANAVTTISEGIRGDIVTRGIHAEKITIIPNGVDPERFQIQTEADSDLKNQLMLDGMIVLGFLGSFYHYEGLSLLLDALPLLLNKDDRYRILLTGGGNQEAALKQQAKNLGIEKKVVFTGRVPHNQIQRYYSLVDILVYPRLSMRLTELVTPLKPLEAMAQGKLVVASDVGGHKELIRHGETGMLFKAGDKTALAETILDLINQKSHWPQLREAGRHFVQSERSWQVSAARYQDVYHRVTTS